MSGTSKWINFFRECGLPISVATNYAVIFTNHRIQKDMLADLNKEYLQEMGITTMGDIISILKLAKCVADKEARDKILTPRGAVPRKSETISLKTSPSARFVGHHIKKNITFHETGNSSRVPVRTARRVLPEQEGGYVIKMPNGNIRRTTSSTTKEDSYQSGKNSVFRRLGMDSVVSSTTDVHEKQSHSTFSSKDSSVFSRLGRNNSQEATSTSDTIEHMDDDDSLLQYQGVLRRRVINTKPTVITSNNRIPLRKQIVFNDKKVFTPASNPVSKNSNYLGRKKHQTGVINLRTQKTAMSSRLGTTGRAKNIRLTPEQKISRLGGVFARLGPIKDTVMM